MDARTGRMVEETRPKLEYITAGAVAIYPNQSETIRRKPERTAVRSEEKRDQTRFSSGSMRGVRSGIGRVWRTRYGGSDSEV